MSLEHKEQRAVGTRVLFDAELLAVWAISGEHAGRFDGGLLIDDCNGDKGEGEGRFEGRCRVVGGLISAIDRVRGDADRAGLESSCGTTAGVDGEGDRGITSESELSVGGGS